MKQRDADKLAAFPQTHAWRVAQNLGCIAASRPIALVYFVRCCGADSKGRLHYLDNGPCRSDSQNYIYSCLYARRNGDIIDDCGFKGRGNGCDLVAARGNPIEIEAALAIGRL